MIHCILCVSFISQRNIRYMARWNFQALAFDICAQNCADPCENTAPSACLLDSQETVSMRLVTAQWE